MWHSVHVQDNTSSNVYDSNTVQYWRFGIKKLCDIKFVDLERLQFFF